MKHTRGDNENTNSFSFPPSYILSFCFMGISPKIRWEIGAVLEELPEYMQICYLAMFNFGNELACDVMKIHGLNTLSYIKKEVS